jgi:hypothetical protein
LCECVGSGANENESVEYGWRDSCDSECSVEEVGSGWCEEWCDGSAHPHDAVGVGVGLCDSCVCDDLGSSVIVSVTVRVL